MRYAAPPYWPDQKPYKPRLTSIIVGPHATAIALGPQGYRMILVQAPANFWENMR